MPPKEWCNWKQSCPDVAGEGRAQHVGGQALSSWPGWRGLRERLDGIFLPQWITADQAEALGAWSPVGVLAAWGILGMWEALRCQWAAAENTQSFREHWRVYRGLVPADSAFSDLKWRESFLSLNSLLHPSVQRSKTIRHHKHRDRTVITPHYSRLQMQEGHGNLKQTKKKPSKSDLSSSTKTKFSHEVKSVMVHSDE